MEHLTKSLNFSNEKWNLNGLEYYEPLVKTQMTVTKKEQNVEKNNKKNKMTKAKPKHQKQHRTKPSRKTNMPLLQRSMSHDGQLPQFSQTAQT